MKVYSPPERLDDLFSIVRVLHKCRKCLRKFSSRKRLKRHAREVHRHRKFQHNASSPKIKKMGVSRGEVSIQDCSKVKVVLKRQRFKELLITTPAEGKRKILFFCDADNPKKGGAIKDDDCIEYEEWREETIDALLKDPSSKAPGESKTLLLSIPYENSFLFDVKGIRDDIHSILEIVSGQKMSWFVLDAYLIRRVENYTNIINAGIRNSYKLRPKLNVRFEYLCCTFLPVFRREPDLEHFRINMRKRPRFELEDCVLIAPQFTCFHLYLAVFDFSKHTIRLYDSSWHFVPLELRCRQVAKILNCLLGLLRPENVEGEEFVVPSPWKIQFAHMCAQQIDEYSCGVYTILFAENELKGKISKSNTKLTKKGIVEIRTQIAFELLQTTFTGRKVLEAITN